MKGSSKTFITVLLTLLTVYEQPCESGKRKIGKLNTKEICKIDKNISKFERTVITASR